MALYISALLLLGIAATGDFLIDYCETKKSAQGARSLRQMRFHSMPSTQRAEDFSVAAFRRYRAEKLRSLDSHTAL